MDYRNKSIAVGELTSFDVNKTIQRSLTKAVARHGLGLYIYAGEDLPEGAEEKKAVKSTPKSVSKKTSTCAGCKAEVTEKVAAYSRENYGKDLCFDCQKLVKAKLNKS